MADEQTTYNPEWRPEWPRVQSCLYSWCPNERDECKRCDEVCRLLRENRERTDDSSSLPEKEKP